VAARIGLVASTLRTWVADACRRPPGPAPARGRPRRALTRAQLRALVEATRRRRRGGVRRLRQQMPGLPRNATAICVRRLRRRQQRRRRWYLRRLHWHLPGAVWAIDGTWLDRPIAPLGRRALIVVELCRKKTLALQSVRGERTAAAIRLLAALFGRHGPPLVLKLDNGSAFTADRLRALCDRHGVVLLHSPVRRPSYNGTCEVSGRWAKRRAMAAASLRGALDTLTQADLDAAVTLRDVLPGLDPATRSRFHAVLEAQHEAVLQEAGLADLEGLGHHQRARLERVAIRRALELCHILTIEGRDYRR